MHNKMICKVDGCGPSTKRLKLGYCQKHYQQFKKYGKIPDRVLTTPNEIVIKKDHAEILLYNNKGVEIARTKIDIKDVEKCRGFKWHISKGYAATTTKTQKTFHLHRFLTGFKFVDHKDRDRLNNKKSNLRKSSYSENGKNKGMSKNNKSGYKGVFFRKDSRKWSAKINHNRKQIVIGCYETKELAAAAYNNAALKYHGSYACLNEIKG